MSTPSLVVSRASTQRSRLIQSDQGGSINLPSLELAPLGTPPPEDRRRRRPTLQKSGNIRSMVHHSTLLIAVRKHEGKGEELSFLQGDTIHYLEQDDNGWVRGCRDDGPIGWFPRDAVKFVSGKNNPFAKEPATQNPVDKAHLSRTESKKNRLNQFLQHRPEKSELQERNVIQSSANGGVQGSKEKKDKISKILRKTTNVFPRSSRKPTQLELRLPTPPTPYCAFGQPLETLVCLEQPIPTPLEQCIEFLEAEEGS